MADPIDYTDPCARAAALRTAYYSILAGDRESLIRTKTNEGEREIRFQAGNVLKLEAELRRAEAECAATLPAAVGPRFAITAG